MNRRLLAPLALVAALALTACTGDPAAPDPTAPLSPDTVLPDAGDSGSDRPEILGGSATVTFDGVTYEFFSDQRVGCYELSGVLQVDLGLESSNGRSFERSDGSLRIELPTPEADESAQGDASVQLTIPDQGRVTYVAGGSDSDLEVTLSVGEYTAHGEQVLEHIGIGGDHPPITAQIDVACNVVE